MLGLSTSEGPQLAHQSPSWPQQPTNYPVVVVSSGGWQRTTMSCCITEPDNFHLFHSIKIPTAFKQWEKFYTGSPMRPRYHKPENHQPIVQGPLPAVSHTYQTTRREDLTPPASHKEVTTRQISLSLPLTGTAH